MTPGLVRVALVNDYEVIVRGLTTMLAPFRNRLAVVEWDVGTNPRGAVDVALFDTYGHGRGGVDRVRSLANDARVGAVAVYTWALPVEQLAAILDAGARGVLAKSTPAGDLVESLLAIGRGELVVSPAFRRPGESEWPGVDFGLTARESEVAAFLAEGLSNREIADALCVSEHTVKSHLKGIFRKVGVSSRGQAMALIMSDPAFRRARPAR